MTSTTMCHSDEGRAWRPFVVIFVTVPLICGAPAQVVRHCD
jgi:hypothetical protein